MDTEILVHNRYIKSLDKLMDSNVEQNKELIQLFNAYVSSNKNYKYNKSYLNDSIEEFFNQCCIYRQKKQKAKEFYQNIINKYKNLREWYIVIDHLFLLEFSGLILIYDALQDNNMISLTQRTILENELSQFNFYSMDKTRIMIKYYSKNDDNNEEYTEIHSLNNEIKINKFVENYLTERVNDDGSIKE